MSEVIGIAMERLWILKCQGQVLQQLSKICCNGLNDDNYMTNTDK